MFNQAPRNLMLVTVLVVFLIATTAGTAVSGRIARHTQTEPPVQEKSRARRTTDGQEPSPSPSPARSPRDELPQESDEVVRVETNLTNIFFTAADKNNRFINTLKREDIRILEDDNPQEVFTFQQNTDLPLSMAILIDTSASEERTLPEEKA